MTGHQAFVWQSYSVNSECQRMLQIQKMTWIKVILHKENQTKKERDPINQLQVSESGSLAKYSKQYKKPCLYPFRFQKKKKQKSKTMKSSMQTHWILEEKWKRGHDKDEEENNWWTK